MNVQLGTKPLITVIDPQTSCGRSLTLTAISSDNSATLKWLESDKATALTSTTVTASGTYYVYALGTQAGCTSDTAVVNVQLGTKPTLDLQPQYTACGSDVKVSYSGLTDASAVVTWLDKDGATVLGNANPFTITNVIEDGTYYVSVLGSGCGDTLPIVVRPHTDPELSLNAGGFSSCTQDVTLSLTALSDLSATVYWLDTKKQLLGTGSPLTINEPVAENGIHYVVAVGSSCHSDTVPFNVLTNSVPVITAESLFTSCDTSVTLRLNSLSDAGATVKWLAGDMSTVVAIGNPVVTTMQANGTYYVYAEGASVGCNSDTLELEVKINTAPVITLNPDGYASCTDLVTLQLLTLSDWSARIEWLNAAGKVVAVGNPGIINDASNGQYKVRVTGQGCANPVEQTFNVKTGQNNLSLDIRPTWDNCNGNVAVSLSSLSDWGAVVKWFDGDGNLFATGNPMIISNADPGKYSVMAQEPMNGCKSDTAHFVIVACDSVTDIIAVATPDTICTANSSQLSVTSPADYIPVSYAWSPSAGLNDTTSATPVFTAMAAGDYTFTVKTKDANGVEKTATVSIHVGTGQAPVLMDLDPVYCWGDSLKAYLAAGSIVPDSYEWYVDGVLQTGVTGEGFVMPATGVHHVKVVAVAGDCKSDIDTVTVDIHKVTVALPSVTQGPVPVGSIIQGTAQASGGTMPYVYEKVSPYDLTWFGADNNRFQFAAQAMAYHIAIYAVDDMGCVSDTVEHDITVTGYTPLDVDLNSQYGTVVCQDGSAILEATVSGGTAGYTYEWYLAGQANPVRVVSNAGSTDQLIVAPTAASSYYVNVKDNGNPLGLGSDTVQLTISPTLMATAADAGPDMTIASGAQTVLLGGGTNIQAWLWTPVNMLNSATEADKQYPLTKALTAQQEYLLYVTDDNNCVSLPDTVEVIIDNVNGLCVKAEPETDTICLNNTVRWTAEITCGPVQGATYAWTPTDLLVGKVDTSSVVFKPMLAGDYAYAVLVTGANGKQAAARVNVKVNDAHAPLLALNGRWDCQNDTIKVTNTGESVTGYTWHLDGGSPLATTDSMLILSLTGQHTVMVYAEAANGCVSDTVEIDAMIGEMPAVHILESSFAQYRDSVFTLHVNQTDQLLNGAFTYQWTSTPSGKIDGSDSQLTMQSKPLTGDVEYVFKASSTVNTVCAATDTVRAYIIPDSIALDIDKDSITGNILLKWDHTQPGLEQADSVRIMGVKWDGYAVATQYTPRAMALADLDQYLVDIANDTLEFFYANASRYIAELGQSYYSHSSDTVGYFRQWVFSNSTKGTINYIAYPFDMSSRLHTIADLANYVNLSTTGDAFAFFNLTSSNWTQIQLCLMGGQRKWMTVANANKALTVGSVYRVIPKINTLSTDFVLYGKLPHKFIYDLDQNKDRWILVPLSYGDEIAFGDLGTDIGLSSGSNMAYHNFNTQGFTTIQLRTMAGKLKWMTVANALKLKKVFTPIKVVSNTSILNWSK